MRITKFVHSCLLVENGQSFLFDPGDYTWKSDFFDINQISRVDKIIITHAHLDHCYPEFVQEILNRFPQAIVIANNEVQNYLASQGLRFEALNYDDDVISFEATHPGSPWAEAIPLNTGYHLFDNLTNPGDSLDFKTSKRILALPITAPWASQASTIERILSLELQPQIVLPLHDWHWQEAARAEAYQKANDVLSKHGISFISLDFGEPVEI